MKLQALLSSLAGLIPPVDHPVLDMEVKGLITNSHACQPGYVFIGMPGTRVDGGEFWMSAMTAGAIAAIVSPHALDKHPATNGELVLPCTDMVAACATLAAAFYGEPAQKLRLVGVTGTNGKTTTTHLIEFLLSQASQPTALLGTLYARWPGYQQTATHTTPFPLDLQEQLASAVGAGCQFAVMEVSSHALAQGRVLGCPFEVAVFTNLTQDHLDYHKDLDDYFSAKALLFSPQYLTGRAIVNQDDPYGQRLVETIRAGGGDSAQAALRDRVWTYSTQDSSADLWTSDLTYQSNGVSGTLHTPVGEIAIQLPLVGQFNVSNALAAAGAALALGLDLETIARALPHFMGVPGRMERVHVKPDQDISVVVDYAHTPDSLENLLKAARPFVPGRMICVFGCGGDRDRTKRPKMGDIAAKLSDLAVVTSDNPRTEDPEQILQDILAGIDPTTTPLVICDRAEAIKTAIIQAQPGDGVLIAGKGHEDYQILGTEKVHFDDREQARAALEQRYSV